MNKLVLLLLKKFVLPGRVKEDTYLGCMNNDQIEAVLGIKPRRKPKPRKDA